MAKWQGHEDAKLIFYVYGKFIDQGYEKAQAGKLGTGNLIPLPQPDGAAELALPQEQRDDGIHQIGEPPT